MIKVHFLDSERSCYTSSNSAKMLEVSVEHSALLNHGLKKKWGKLPKCLFSLKLNENELKLLLHSINVPVQQVHTY